MTEGRTMKKHGKIEVAVGDADDEVKAGNKPDMGLSLSIWRLWITRS